MDKKHSHDLSRYTWHAQGELAVAGGQNSTSNMQLRDYNEHYDNKLLNSNMLIESTTVLSSLQSTSLIKITYHKYSLFYLLQISIK